jgi:hypothetical protein
MTDLSVAERITRRRSSAARRVGARDIPINRERLERGLGALQPILAPCPFGGILRGVRSGREPGERRCGNRP